MNANDHDNDEPVCRRCAERLKIAMPVVLITAHYGTAVIKTGSMEDLSEGGMRVVVDTPLQDGQTVSIEFTVPVVSQLLKMRALVRHCHDNLYGFQFEEATDQQRHHIRMLAASA